jgi:hypothetical protein
MKSPLPPAAVTRLSQGIFDPVLFAEVERMSQKTAEYLIPAIRKLRGLIHYFAAVSPAGSFIHVSIWESDADANQMSTLKEMIVDARRDAEAVGVTFTPIVNHPVSWDI